MRGYRLRRVASIIRWLAIGWILVAYLVPPLLPGVVVEWDDFFDDAFLMGAVPGTLGLLLSYVVDKAGRKADHSASGRSR